MVLVTAAYRRRGFATALLKRSIDELTAAGFVPALDATPDGRAVYRGLGFMDAWGLQRMARSGQGAAPAPAAELRGLGIRAITDDVWPALCAYDAAAFGADRAGLLARLRARAPDTALYANATAGSQGCCLAAKAASRRRSVRSLPRARTLRKRCWQARSPPSMARSSWTSRMPKPPPRHISRRQASPASGRSRACFMGVPLLSTTAPAHPHLRGRRSGIRIAPAPEKLQTFS